MLRQHLETNNKMLNFTTSEGCLNCRGCCLFSDEEDATLSPYISEKEATNIPRECLREVRTGLYQAKVISTSLHSCKYACAFLKEQEYRCSIYNIRPIECAIWPFCVCPDSAGNGYFLCVVNQEWCHAVKEGKVFDRNIISSILEYLDKSGYLQDIKDGIRSGDPLHDSYIILEQIIF